MPRTRDWRVLLAIIFIAGTQFVLAGVASAAPPVVKTVPWVATNPLIPHDTYPTKAVTVKGTADVQGGNITWTWDFGDGTPVATGTVSNMFAIEATHTYAGVVGTIFTARLTVQNTTTGETGSKEYFVKMQAKSLPIEVNIAIDEGLWYLHKNFYRYSSGGKDFGSWMTGCGGGVCAGYTALQAANVNAFFVNGHRVDGLASNPYTDTVQRAMRRFFELLSYGSTSLKTYTGGSYGANLGSLDPDCAGCAPGDPSDNGIYLYIGNDTYQMGIVTTALAASGTPTAVADTGGANVVGRTYRAMLQDLVDWFVWGQESRGASGCWGFGGWHYGVQYCSADNSTAQWGAIALLGAESFGKLQYGPTDPGIQIPSIVRQANPYWLSYSFQQFGTGNIYGAFGYSSAGYYPWGPWATTPSGLVQLAFDGLGRGGSDQKWEKTEKYVRDNFGNTGGAGSAIKDYYYGLYAFVKAMLLHVNEGTGLKDPITLLGADLDWYAAEVGSGAPTDGVARTLVGDQSGAHWNSHYYSAEQTYFETSWAIQMLNRTVTESGAPVAVANAIPNPAVAGQTVTLDGSASFHQDASKSITQWDWDINNDGVFELHGPVVTNSWPVVGSYPVKLRVTDNLGTTADTIVTALVSTPPLAPTANAGGPYNLCLAPVGVAQPPFFLDGSKSVNPDEGQSEPTKPPDTIYGDPSQFSWNLGTAFGDAIGVNPNVTSIFTAKGVGSYLIQLRVTDTTATSFPSSGMGNLSSTASGQVFVRAATDPVCASCIGNLAALSKNKTVQLTWTLLPGVHHYNVYRGTLAGGPYVLIGSAISTQTVYFDFTVTNGLTYYYVVRPAALSGAESCQSNEVIGRPRALR